MPKRFEAYRMRDGETPLSEDFFNAVFGDIDARIAELEARRADWQGVIDELTKFGLERINALVGPSMDEVSAMLVQLRQRRDELEAAIGNVGQLVTAQQLAAAITAEHDARAMAVQQARDFADTKVASVNGVAGKAITLKPSHLALGPANGPANVEFTYDGAGRVSTIASSVDAKPSVQAITYDGAGRVSTITTTYDGRKRTETCAYNPDGSVASVAAVEEAQ